MSKKLLTAAEAAKQLGISVTTLYDWLSRADYGDFHVRGQVVAIEYFQGGARGEGRIRIAAAEVDRLQESMLVTSQVLRQRHPPIRRETFPGITVKLGKPP